MPAEAGIWRWVVAVVREDDAPVEQREVSPDWTPSREWSRWLAVLRGEVPDAAFTATDEVIPRWDGEAGEPRLGGIRLRGAGAEVDFGLEPFREPAQALIAGLVREGRLVAGDRIRWRALAFAREPASEAAPNPLGRPAAPAIRLRTAPLDHGAAAAAGEDHPVLIPAAVLAEVRDRTLATPDRETGGILIGFLGRDPASHRVFARVTAQVPARHTDACATRLTFTPDTWTDARSALALRGREEIMLGWWHSHPVRAWCRDCDEACRSRCTLGEGFLSADDRRLHREVFPRAFTVALVASDVADDGPAVTLFGWRRGQLLQRTYTAMEGESA